MDEEERVYKDGVSNQTTPGQLINTTLPDLFMILPI